MARGPTDFEQAAAPETVFLVLLNAADMYRESAAELEAAWQDPKAGRIWNKIATILERAAGQVDKVVKTELGRR